MNPQTLPSPIFRKFMILLASIICVFYLAYRLVWTLNVSTNYAIFASIFLYVGEFFGIMNLLIYFLQVWDVDEPPAEPVLEGRTVDVLIPTYNEGPTAASRHARSVYPHGLPAQDLRARRRPPAGSRGTGARNGRHLHQSGGQPPCQGRQPQTTPWSRPTANSWWCSTPTTSPEPHFITRLIGYFRDDKVAFVQNAARLLQLRFVPGPARPQEPPLLGRRRPVLPGDSARPQ